MTAVDMPNSSAKELHPRKRKSRAGVSSALQGENAFELPRATRRLDVTAATAPGQLKEIPRKPLKADDSASPHARHSAHTSDALETCRIETNRSPAKFS